MPPLRQAVPGSDSGTFADGARVQMLPATRTPSPSGSSGHFFAVPLPGISPARTAVLSGLYGFGSAAWSDAAHPAGSSLFRKRASGPACDSGWMMRVVAPSRVTTVTTASAIRSEPTVCERPRPAARASSRSRRSASGLRRYSVSSPRDATTARPVE